MKKTISILIPCYNEEENVVPMSEAIVNLFETQLTNYNYELVFIDNDSHDKTRELLREICSKNPNIKAIFNAKNFGQFNSPYYGILQTTGDCTISMVCDFQDPIELIPQYIKEWENGYKIVIGIKTSSKESKIMYFLRSVYYKMIKKFSDVEQIEHFTGSGLYDRSFVEVLRNLKDPKPFMRGIVAELGFKRKEIPYEQPQRRAGKTHNNFYTLYVKYYILYEDRTSPGYLYGLWSRIYQYDCGTGIPDYEAGYVEPVSGGYGTDSDRNVLPGSRTAVLYRTDRRIYSEY